MREHQGKFSSTKNAVICKYLTTEIFKIKNGLFPEIVNEIFVCQENETYKLRNGNH